MKNIAAVFNKQIKDTKKNKTVLIQFIMFPVMTIIMNSAVKIDNMPKNFFTELFSVMYIGMAPLVSSASIVSEEKEKGTLRALLMAGVKPSEYLAGVGSYIWLACMLGSLIMVFSGDYAPEIIPCFLAVMAVGFVFPLIIGTCVGVSAGSQMAATSVSVPLMMAFSFLPMLAMFNQKVEIVAKFTYTQQIQVLLANIGCGIIKPDTWLILGVNGILAILLFVFVYKKSGLE